MSLNKRRALLSVCLTLLANSAHAVATAETRQFLWRAVEVYGNSTLSDEAALDGLPIRMGSSSAVDKEELDRWCTAKTARLHVKRFDCATVFLRRDRAYLVIDIVEKDSTPNTLNPIRATTITADSLDRTLLDAASEFQTILERRFFSGLANTYDKSNVNYLDYVDTTLRTKAKELNELSRGHADTVVAIALNSNDPKQRRIATFLLNWIGEPSRTIPAVRSLILDSDANVRNSATNFVLAFIGQVTADEVLSQIQGALFDQAKLPSHTDRNKALYALQEVVVATKHSVQITPSQMKLLDEIVARAHLPNISAPARFLLQLAREQSKKSAH